MPKTTSATAAVSKKSDEKGAVQKVPAKKFVVKKGNEKIIFTLESIDNSLKLSL